jgi:hypothetical protein
MRQEEEEKKKRGEVCLRKYIKYGDLTYQVLYSLI